MKIKFSIWLTAICVSGCTEIGLVYDEHMLRPGRENELRKLWVGRSESELYERLGKPAWDRASITENANGIRHLYYYRKKSLNGGVLYENICERFIEIREGKVFEIYESGATCKNFPYKGQDPSPTQ